MKRIYHHYNDWEDAKNGLYNSHAKNPEEIIKNPEKVIKQKTLILLNFVPEPVEQIRI